MRLRAAIAALLTGTSLLGCPEREKSDPPLSATPPPAAVMPPPPAAPEHVVVRTASASSDFARFTARCLAGERLVGGGCGGGCAKLETSAPIDFGPSDTEGAGWACKCGSVASGERATAYALCQGITAAPPDAGPPARPRRGGDLADPFSTGY